MTRIGRDDAPAAIAPKADPQAASATWQYWLGVPLIIYATSRIAQIAMLAWLVPPGSSVYQRLLSWDSGWFIRVAQQGYPHAYTRDAAGHLTANGLAFFPLFPWLIRAVHGLGLDYGVAALAISWTAGAVAAIVLNALARRLWQRPMAGYALTALFCAQPMSVVLSMGYSESLFVALVAGSLVAAARAPGTVVWWLIAGGLAALAGLTRPTGAAVAVAVTVAAATRIFRGRIQPAAARASFAEVAAAVFGAVLALAAVPSYLLWVGLRVGDISGWFKIQSAGWGTRFDWGRGVWDFLISILRSDGGWVATSVALLLIVASVALIISLRRRVWAPLAVYGVISFVLVIGQAGYFHSKPRLLVPVLLILVPAALAATRAKPRAASLWLIAYAAFGIWYGAYMITVWPYAI